LLLGADEEDALATGDHLPRHLLRELDLPLRLAQVDDVDAVALREDELAHLRVPAARLVSEMDASFQEVLDLGGVRHEESYSVAAAHNRRSHGLIRPPPSSAAPTALASGTRRGVGPVCVMGYRSSAIGYRS